MKENTFVEVHEDTVPAKHMPTTCHLWGLKSRLQTNRAMQLLFGMIDYVSDFDPFMPFDSFETRKTLKLL